MTDYLYFSRVGSRPRDARGGAPPTHPLDQRNLRRKIELFRILRPLNEQKRIGRLRPAQLYEFSASRFEKLKDKGILFPF